MPARILNLEDAEPGPESPECTTHGVDARPLDIQRARIASRIGARKLGCNLTMAAPGKRYLSVSAMAPREICEYPDNLPDDGNGWHVRFRHLARHEHARN